MFYISQTNYWNKFFSQVFFFKKQLIMGLNINKTFKKWDKILSWLFSGLEGIFLKSPIILYFHYTMWISAIYLKLFFINSYIEEMSKIVEIKKICHNRVLDGWSILNMKISNLEFFLLVETREGHVAISAHSCVEYIIVIVLFLIK